jgi:hypothetical protein
MCSKFRRSLATKAILLTSDRFAIRRPGSQRQERTQDRIASSTSLLFSQLKGLIRKVCSNFRFWKVVGKTHPSSSPNFTLPNIY